MPHLTLSFDRFGPLVQVGVGVSQSMRKVLLDAGERIPDLQPANALIDTGASASMVDPAIVAPLGLTPVSFSPVLTPSTAGVPVMQPVYDVSIWMYHPQTKHVWERSFPVLCASLRSQGIDMLLGRDILSECLLVLDGRANQFAIAF